MKIKKFVRGFICGLLIIAVIVLGYAGFHYYAASSIVNSITVHEADAFDINYAKKNLFKYELFYKYFYRDYVIKMGLQGNERVLDFGCGTGFEATPLAEILSQAGGELTCLDISAAALEVAKLRLRKFKNIKYILGDIRDGNIPPNSYEIVVIHIVLHDIDKQSRNSVVKTMYRLLGPGGKIYIREPTEKKHGMPADEIRQIMKQNGFKKLSFIEKEISGLMSPPFDYRKMCEGVFQKPR